MFQQLLGVKGTSLDLPGWLVTDAPCCTWVTIVLLWLHTVVTVKLACSVPPAVTWGVSLQV